MANGNKPPGVLDYLTVLLSALNLIAVLYVARLTLSQQKELEIFKKQLASAQISYSYTEGVLNVINSGDVEAKNVKIFLNTGLDIDCYFLTPGIPPFAPEIDKSLNPGRALIYRIESLSPGEFLNLAIKKRGSGENLLRTDLSLQITCSNCAAAAQEK